MIRFSIITVVRNDAVGVIRTLQSIFSQTYQNFELIVQDGASTDGTSDVLPGFGDWIDSLTIEKDAGIYDAMNRALRRASGDYMLFMNAADFFIDKNVLATVAEMIDPAKDDIFAGKAISDETGKVHKYRPPDRFWAGSTLDHQATFIRASLMKRFEYNPNYRISGDLHFFTRARQAGATFRYEDVVIARKPFAVGASSDFIDRVNDRLTMLEKAWGDKYPVRELILREIRYNMQTTFDCPESMMMQNNIPDTLQMRSDWLRYLNERKSV